MKVTTLKLSFPSLRHRNRLSRVPVPNRMDQDKPTRGWGSLECHRWQSWHLGGCLTSLWTEAEAATQIWIRFMWSKSTTPYQLWLQEHYWNRPIWSCLNLLDNGKRLRVYSCPSWGGSQSSGTPKLSRMVRPVRLQLHEPLLSVWPPPDKRRILLLLWGGDWIPVVVWRRHEWFPRFRQCWNRLHWYLHYVLKDEYLCFLGRGIWLDSKFNRIKHFNWQNCIFNNGAHSRFHHSTCL